MMPKMILVTGSTDGIGWATAHMLCSMGHHVLLHGRHAAKLEQAAHKLSALSNGGRVDRCMADLSSMADVDALAETIIEQHGSLDVLINNAGVYRAPVRVTQDGLDVRFAVNTLAPYHLTRRLLPLLGPSGRVLNVSSAAQASVEPAALAGAGSLSDGAAYAQSKLALTMWSRSMGLAWQHRGVTIMSVNPGSMLGSKMVKDAFGVDGRDVEIGATILVRAALDAAFASAAGQYFDNDKGQFGSPHPDALDPARCEAIVRVMEEVLAEKLPQ